MKCPAGNVPIGSAMTKCARSARWAASGLSTRKTFRRTKQASDRLRTDGEKLGHPKRLDAHGSGGVKQEGERLLTDQQPAGDEQRFHSGLVKVRELEHDAAIYPAYREAAEAIERDGGTVDRVVLDYEFKSVINAEMNRGGLVSGEARDERRAKLAEELDLEIVDGRLPLPDLRIEYTDAEGERHHEDIEIVSEHYRGAHLAGKSAAGFKLVNKDGPRTAVPDQKRKRF